MAPVAPSQSCVEHEGRISAIESDARTCREDRRDLWSAVNGLRDATTDTRTSSATTLEVVKQILTKVEQAEKDIKVLMTAKAEADGARRRDKVILATLSTITGGVGTWAVTHWMGGGK
jgi:septal ring factor EnvC (AmiA/AmiB activator)